MLKKFFISILGSWYYHYTASLGLARIYLRELGSTIPPA